MRSQGLDSLKKQPGAAQCHCYMFARNMSVCEKDVGALVARHMRQPPTRGHVGSACWRSRSPPPSGGEVKATRAICSVAESMLQAEECAALCDMPAHVAEGSAQRMRITATYAIFAVLLKRDGGMRDKRGEWLGDALAYATLPQRDGALQHSAVVSASVICHHAAY